MKTVLIVLTPLVAIWYLLHRSGNPAFWRLVRRRPDLAMAWFESEGCWMIVRKGEPAPSSFGYTLGFSVFDPSTNEYVKVYCIGDQLERSQARFLAKYGTGGAPPLQ